MAVISDFVIWAQAQLTDKMDPMNIMPKDLPVPHNDAHVICFLSVSNFGHQRPQKQFVLL